MNKVVQPWSNIILTTQYPSMLLSIPGDTMPHLTYTLTGHPCILPPPPSLPPSTHAQSGAIASLARSLARLLDAQLASTKGGREGGERACCRYVRGRRGDHRRRRRRHRHRDMESAQLLYLRRGFALLTPLRHFPLPPIISCLCEYGGVKSDE